MSETIVPQTETRTLELAPDVTPVVHSHATAPEPKRESWLANSAAVAHYEQYQQDAAEGTCGYWLDN